MYNRYIRNDQGGYSRVPVDENPFPAGEQPGGTQWNGSGATSPPPRQEPHRQAQETEPPHHHGNAPPPPPSPPPHGEGGGDGRTGGISGYLRRILDKFHLESVDTGDVLLLLILFFLFKEDADDELLIALGLLLIL